MEVGERGRAAEAAEDLYVRLAGRVRAAGARAADAWPTGAVAGGTVGAWFAAVVGRAGARGWAARFARSARAVVVVDGGGRARGASAAWWRGAVVAVGSGVVALVTSVTCDGGWVLAGSAGAVAAPVSVAGGDGGGGGGRGGSGGSDAWRSWRACPGARGAAGVRRRSAGPGRRC